MTCAVCSQDESKHKDFWVEDSEDNDGLANFKAFQKHLVKCTAKAKDVKVNYGYSSHYNTISDQAPAGVRLV